MTEAMQRALDAVQTPKRATHAIYTPAWKPEWDDQGQITAGKFRAWLAVGEAWQEASGDFTLDIHCRPINPQETATSFFRCVPIGAPPPAPLTITRDEYLEQQFSATHAAK
jgi:hypothetical protein